MDLTAQRLARAVPRVDVERWFIPVRDACVRFDIDTPHRMAAFLGQCGHESANFTRLVENLNYSAQGLADTWPSRFSTGSRTRATASNPSRHIPNAMALSLHRRPEAIANSVYADRLGNGKAASGDGWRFRGRGLIQLTGRANYRAASEALGVDLTGTPEALEDPPMAALASAWWWHANRANLHADTADWLAVSRLVNLGNPQSTVTPHGVEDRRQRTLLALEALQDLA